MIAEMLAVWMLGTMTQNDKVALRNSLRLEKLNGGSKVAQSKRCRKDKADKGIMFLSDVPLQPCLWPNLCQDVAQFTTCVLPHKCVKKNEFLN